MKRRHFLTGTAAAGVTAATTGLSQGLETGDRSGIRGKFPALAEAALERAKALGATFADFRITAVESENISTREDMIQGINTGRTLGASVRVLAGGSWGFAATPQISDASVRQLADRAVVLARSLSGWRREPVEIEELPAHVDRWEMPVKIDPFEIPLEEKTAQLLAINAIALKKGADYCNSSLSQVRETKWLANSFGSQIEQSRVRIFPRLSVTTLDRKKGLFASRDSLAPPRGAGFEYFRDYDFETEAALAVEQAREKMAAPSVTPGKMDLVIHPSNLWLTIHETVGHPTELDRALGFEANYAGTSFCTPDKLGVLQYGSDLVTMRGDRTQEDGLATVAYDDDGVKSAGKEFDIIEHGIFRNYQMALGQAHKIGRERSNGCAFSAGFDAIPLQRMPNISLQPGPDPSLTTKDLIAGVEDGIYIVGNGSWSIDQQRYNFQFTGQVFHRIRKGKLDGMFKNVAYQGNSVEFWNACDALGGAPSYELHGAMNCGKGRPSQLAPVSHGAVPARFRRINILNTEEESGRKTAAQPPCGNSSPVA